jgi:hypothetical protein
MVNTANAVRWEQCGASVRGVAHARTGLPNQDAIELWQPNGDGGLPAIMAVSDGHGSAPHVRSAMGARFGVEAAVEILREFSRDPKTMAELTMPDAQAARLLPQMLVAAWTRSVDMHVNKNPMSELDWTHVPDADKEAARRAVAQDSYLAYGATLLSVLVTEAFIVFLQIGDGDILCVSERGETSRPVPPDPRLVANRTTSLCQPGAAVEFRINILRAPEQFPALIVLSTDGYANAFRTDEDYLMIGRDYLEMFRVHGRQGLEGQLKEILTEASAKGSGDDITVGLLEQICGTQETETQVRESGKHFETALNPPDMTTDSRELGVAFAALRQRVHWFLAALVLTALLSIASLGVSLYNLKAQVALSNHAAPDLHKQHALPLASKDTEVPALVLRITPGSPPIPLSEGTIIIAEQAGLDSQAFGEEVARIEVISGRHELSILNNSKRGWIMIPAKGKQQGIRPGAEADLTEGATIKFDSQHVVTVENAPVVEPGGEQ